MLTRVNAILRFGVAIATVEIGTFTVGVAPFTVGEWRLRPHLWQKSPLSLVILLDDTFCQSAYRLVEVTACVPLQCRVALAFQYL